MNDGVNMEGPLLKENSSICLHVNIVLAIMSRLFFFITRFHLLMEGWRGYLIAGFSLVWVANFYMSLFGLLRTDLKKEKTAIKKLEEE